MGGYRRKKRADPNDITFTRLKCACDIVAHLRGHHPSTKKWKCRHCGLVQEIGRGKRYTWNTEKETLRWK